MAGLSGKAINLFRLPAPYYLKGSPVIISEASLLMGRFSEEESIRLSLKNITDTLLVSCEVQITLYDAEHNCYPEALFFRYEGMRVPRESLFGDKKRIPLPDNRVRSFSVLVTEVILSDYTHWKNTDPFAPISPMETLQTALKSEDLAKQYTIRYGNDCEYMPAEIADLWYCVCGAVNHASEALCYKCRRKRAAFTGVNERSLKRDSEERVKSEKLLEEAEQRAKIKKQKTAKLILRLSLIILPVLLNVSVILATIPPFLNRKENYAAAEQLLESGAYEEAREAFLSLGDYSDARQRAEQDVPYERALYVLSCASKGDLSALQLLGLSEKDIGDSDPSMFLYGQARELFSAMDGYRESDAKIAEIDAAFVAYEENQRQLAYEAASALLESGAYLCARDAFLAMDGYQDSEQMAVECLYRRACRILDFCENNNARKIYLAVSDDAGTPTAVSMSDAALTTLGSETVGELRACFQSDGVEVFYENEPGSTEESGGRSYLPVYEAAAAAFAGLDCYKDSDERIARAEAAGDFTAEFYALLYNGQLSEAAVWLNTYDDDVPERDAVPGWADIYETWRRHWTFSSGDSNLIPYSVGMAEDVDLPELSSKVCIRNGKAVLCLEQPDGQCVAELECELGETDFRRVNNGNYYYASINLVDHFAYMRYFEDGTMVSSCDYIS